MRSCRHAGHRIWPAASLMTSSGRYPYAAASRFRTGLTGSRICHRCNQCAKEFLSNPLLTKVPSNRDSNVKFSTGTLASIHSISQRGLAAYWQRLSAGSRAIPSFHRFQPEERLHDPKQIAVWKVEPGEGRPVFRALYRGRLLDEAFNYGWVGRTLDEVAPPGMREAIVTASNECARTACANYTVIRTFDSAYHAVDLERLLLPFGENGRVEQIVASLQLVSPEGDFERKTIVSQFEARLVCVLALNIPFDANVDSPEGALLEVPLGAAQ
jgi:hypothetical protein